LKDENIFKRIKIYISLNFYTLKIILTSKNTTYSILNYFSFSTYSGTFLYDGRVLYGIEPMKKSCTLMISLLDSVLCQRFLSF